MEEEANVRKLNGRGSQSSETMKMEEVAKVRKLCKWKR